MVYLNINMELPYEYYDWLTRNKVTDYDRPDSFYDYYSAYKAGVNRDATGHFDSRFKRLGHPNLIIDGIDTRTGKKANSALEIQNRRERERILLEMVQKGIL